MLLWLLLIGGLGTLALAYVAVRGPSASKVITAPGTYQYVCTLHSYIEDGVYKGMVGTLTVTDAPAGDAPSGVDYTEYRVNTGATQGDWTKATNTAGTNPYSAAE